MEPISGRERRMSPRIPTKLGLQVYAYGMLVAVGVTVDVSNHGLLMLIEKDFSDDALNPGKHLDIVLDDYGRVAEPRWMPIMVMRKWDGGVAARFVGVEADGSVSHAMN